VPLDEPAVPLQFQEYEVPVPLAVISIVALEHIVASGFLVSVIVGLGLTVA
jgi:hypothetical protein